MPIPRLLTSCLLAATVGLLLASFAPDLAWGGSTGGAGAGGAGAGGSTTATPTSTDSGGALVGAQTSDGRPTAPIFHLAPKAITVGQAAPRIVLRVEQLTSPTVKAAIKIVPPSGGKTTTLKLGSIRTGTAVKRTVPKTVKLVAGTYTFVLSVTDRTGQHLKTSRTGTGRASLQVKAKAAPAPTAERPGDDTGEIVPDPNGDAPSSSSSDTAKTTSSSGARFPVQGAHTFGGSGAAFGAGRTGHEHQGQDVVADAGLPVVAPTAGEVTQVGYQASAAGEWIAVHAADGRDFFFAHCIRHSTVVSEGTTVRPGTRLCSVGATGDASGPHLHFEIWIDGWRTSKASHPIDPLPQLKQWQSADPKW